MLRKWTLQISQSRYNRNLSASFVITSRGTGDGVAILALESVGPVILALTGTARFYDNSAGTLNPGTTRTVAPGSMNYLYIKAPSGESTLKISNSERIIKWGDPDYENEWAGYIDGFYSAGDNTPGISGVISKSTLPNIRRISLLNYEYGYSINISMHLGDAPRGLEEFELASNGLITGTTKDMPRGLRYTYTFCDNPVTGRFRDLPPAMEYFWFMWWSGTELSQMYGTAAEIPSSVIKLAINGGEIISGDFKDLHRGMFSLVAGSMYDTLHGDISDLPPSMTQFSYYGVGEMTYTGGRVWPPNVNFIKIKPSAYGLSVAETSALIIDLAAAAWNYGKAASYCYVKGLCESMADTSQGGIWGNFSGEISPSALAIALKALNAKVEPMFNGITLPAATGDGTGFPAGFGNWWRS